MSLRGWPLRLRAMQRTISLWMQLLMLHKLPIRRRTTNNLIKIHLVIYIIIVGVEVTARSAIINKNVNNGIVYFALEKCSLCLCSTLFYCGFALDENARGEKVQGVFPS
jgi:hypothetical protein